MTIREHVFKRMQIIQPIWIHLGITGQPKCGDKTLFEKNFVSVKEVLRNNKLHFLYTVDNGKIIAYSPYDQFGPNIYFLATSVEDFLNWKPIVEPDNILNDWEREYFDAMTDGQFGDFDDYKEKGGDIDNLEDLIHCCPR